MAECPHGLEVGCTICKHGPTPRPQAPRVVATFRARYAGSCSGCHDPINVGDVVHKMTDETYRHGGCE